ncbi:MAG: tetratricopeptide repeat protein [Cyanophyceae cyanobacterium]
MPVTTAQTANPLEIATDPLLPQPGIERPLSPLERSRVESATAELDSQARRELKAGNEAGAIALWYRELRLQRALGPRQEIQALGKVGEIAWNYNRPVDVQNITNRLEMLEQNTPIAPAQLQAFGQAYEQVKALEQAVSVYQQVLAAARDRSDEETKMAMLEKLGQLHLDLFNYPQAAAVYEELLAKARSQSDRFSEGQHLHQLAQIYSQAMQPQHALRIKEQLAESYLNGQVEQLPALKISIASDYEALNQPEAAGRNYEEAFTLAWSLQQVATAGDALQKLGDLYRNNNQQDYALQIYQELLKVEQQTYDFYGLMNTYDRIGQIYVEQNNNAQAIAAYNKALQVARSLGYQEEYFSEKIEALQN